MRRRVVVLAVAVLTAGAARAGSIEVDFNPNADFDRYRTWAFAAGREEGHRGVLADAVMRKRVETALAGCLEEAGLRLAGPSETADLLVRYQGDIGVGKTVTTSEGYLYDGLAPAYKTMRFNEQVMTLIVDLTDRSTSALAWRLYLNQKYGGPNDPPDKLLRALEKGISKYPPSASARARKAREIEKASGD